MGWRGEKRARYLLLSHRRAECGYDLKRLLWVWVEGPGDDVGSLKVLRGAGGEEGGGRFSSETYELEGGILGEVSIRGKC